MNLYRSPKQVCMALAALVLLPAGWAIAQGTAGAPSKIAVINVQQAIVATQEGKQASDQLQVQFAPQQNDMQNMQKQISDLQTKLANGQHTLSEDDQARLQRQGTMLSNQLQHKQDDFQEELQAAQSDMVNTIGRKMLDVLDKYAKDNGIAVVLDSSAQGGSVVYGATQLDITTDIVKLYDQAYPVKATSSGDSAAPKPATSAAKPAGTASSPSGSGAAAPVKKP
jgi:outer membrane protein